MNYGAKLHLRSRISKYLHDDIKLCAYRVLRAIGLKKATILFTIIQIHHITDTASSTIDTISVTVSNIRSFL